MSRKIIEFPEFLTAKEIQMKTRISKAGVYNLINSGQIPVMKIGSRMLIPKKEFLDWLKEQEVKRK